MSFYLSFLNIWKKIIITFLKKNADLYLIKSINELKFTL